MENKNVKSAHSSLNEIKSLLLITCGCIIGTANVNLLSISGAVIKVIATAFIFFCLFMTYKKAKNLADMAN